MLQFSTSGREICRTVNVIKNHKIKKGNNTLTLYNDCLDVMISHTD